MSEQNPCGVVRNVNTTDLHDYCLIYNSFLQLAEREKIGAHNTWIFASIPVEAGGLSPFYPPFWEELVCHLSACLVVITRMSPPVLGRCGYLVERVLIATGGRG